MVVYGWNVKNWMEMVRYQPMVARVTPMPAVVLVAGLQSTTTECMTSMELSLPMGVNYEYSL